MLICKMSALTNYNQTKLYFGLLFILILQQN